MKKTILTMALATTVLAATAAIGSDCCYESVL